MTLSLQIFWNQSYIDLCSQTTTIQSHSLNNQLHSTYHLGILWIPFLETWRAWFIITFPSLYDSRSAASPDPCQHVVIFFARPSCWQIACKVWHKSPGSEEFKQSVVTVPMKRVEGAIVLSEKKAMSTDGGRGGGDTAVHRWVSFGCKNWLWTALFVNLTAEKLSTPLTSSL